MSHNDGIIPVNIPLRLISADDVKAIICKYENRKIQHTMILEIEKLSGCLATEEQRLQILGDKKIEFEKTGGYGMSQVVEITIDLTSTNYKPKIEAFGITNTSETNIYCKGGAWGNTGRRFFIPNMDKAKYRGFLKYTYRYRTKETDCAVIVKSKETEHAIREILRCLEMDLKSYQCRFEKNADYCEKNYANISNV